MGARWCRAYIDHILRDGGFDPRKVGHDSWESRCPAHRSADHALSIARKELNHVELACRSTAKCPDFRIIGAWFYERSCVRGNP